MRKKQEKIGLGGCVCGPMRRGQRARRSIGQALASSCFTASALRSGKRVPIARMQARPMPAAFRLCVRLLAAAVRFGFAGYTQRSNSDAAESFRTAAGFLRRRRADFWHHSTTPPVGIVYMRYGRAAGSHLSHGAQNLNFARSFWNPFETRPNSTSSC